MELNKNEYSFTATIKTIEVRRSWRDLWRSVNCYVLEWDTSRTRTKRFVNVQGLEIKPPSVLLLWDRCKILESYTIGDKVELVMSYADTLNQRRGADAFSVKINGTQLSKRSIFSGF